MRIFYAQSGGVTSVINTTCAGLLHAAKKNNIEVLVGLNGIHGVFEEKFISSYDFDSSDIELLAKTPGGSFGSCRYKVKKDDHSRILSFIKKYNIEAFVYHGGNDSMDTCHKISKLCQEEGLSCAVIGLPKTIDNDLVGTDQCPGFGSAAKYLNVSFDEASLDITSMYRDSTKVFILETMGRHSGWLAASCGLTRYSKSNHLLLTPERNHDLDNIAQTVQSYVQRYGFCSIALSEGAQLGLNSNLKTSHRDSFGHMQLGGIGFSMLTWLKEELNIKSHLAVSDYLQRSAGHCLSKVDFDQAFELGNFVVQALEQKQTGVMLTVVRNSSHPYKWVISSISLEKVANKERFVPKSFINSNYQLTDSGREYFFPLIQGEVEQKWENGLPVYWPHRLTIIGR